MTKFDWRTDEEQGWERPRPDRTPPFAPQPWWRVVAQRLRRHRRPFLASVFILLALGALSVRSLSLRVQEAEAAARDELLTVYTLLLDAAANRDGELFLTMLGGDRSWRQAQLATFERNVLFERHTLGLTWQAQAEPTAQIELSPDLQQALITGTLRYEGYAGGGAHQNIALQHTLRFERDGAQWRLAPHEQAHFDGWLTLEARRLQTVFPRQDEALAGRLTEDFDATLEALCDGLVDCPARLHIQLRFELNHETLHTPAMWINAMRRDSFSLALPAPSLVGVPVDDSGYRAVRNAYARVIAEHLLQVLVPRTIESDAFRDAVVRDLHAQLDLIAWPPPAATAPGAKEGIGGDIVALCAAGLTHRASLLRYDAARGAWLTELRQRDIGRLSPLGRVPGVLLVEQDGPNIDPQPRIVWWADGREMASFTGYYLGDTVAAGHSFIANATDGQPFWTYLGRAAACDGQTCAGVVMRAEPTAWSPDGDHTLFRRELEGSRSPPASDDILWLGDGDGATLRRLDEGFRAFWIDDETFGYLARPQGRPQSYPFDFELIVGRLQEDTSGVVLEEPVPLTEALLALLPGGEPTDERAMFINDLFAHPARPHIVYILGARFVRYSNVAPIYNISVFALDRRSGEIALRIRTGQMQWVTLPRLSPDGRWLAYVAFDPLTRRGLWAVHDLAQDPPQGNEWERAFAARSAPSRQPGLAAPSFDWSQDDGKLLFLEQGVLHIVDPQTWTERQIIPPTPACAHAAWAD